MLSSTADDPRLRLFPVQPPKAFANLVVRGTIPFLTVHELVGIGTSINGDLRRLEYILRGSETRDLGLTKESFWPLKQRVIHYTLRNEQPSAKPSTLGC